MWGYTCAIAASQGKHASMTTHKFRRFRFVYIETILSGMQAQVPFIAENETQTKLDTSISSGA